jgi:hypothetical protein
MQKMKELYANTEAVFIWLGEEAAPARRVNSRDLPSMDVPWNLSKNETRITAQGRPYTVRLGSTQAGGIAVTSVANFIRVFAKDQHLSNMHYFRRCEKGVCLDGGGCTHLHYSTDWVLALQAIQDLIRLPWFSRTWTL